MDHKVHVHVFSPSDDPEKWLNEYNKWANQCKITEEEKIACLPQFLEYSVQNWFTGLPDNQKQPFYQNQLQLHTFESSMQQPGETALQYISKMKKMGHNLKLSEENI